MRPLATLGLVAAALLAGCGGGPPTPESVVRAWSTALNADDNESAADFFAEGARVIQSGRQTRLETRAEAISWNSSLPCSGEIVSIFANGETVRATFRLGHRTATRCDGPGATATALVRVRDGKIVLWHQVATQRPPLDAA